MKITLKEIIDYFSYKNYILEDSNDSIELKLNYDTQKFLDFLYSKVDSSVIINKIYKLSSPLVNSDIKTFIWVGNLYKFWKPFYSTLTNISNPNINDKIHTITPLNNILSNEENNEHDWIKWNSTLLDSQQIRKTVTNKVTISFEYKNIDNINKIFIKFKVIPDEAYNPYIKEYSDIINGPETIINNKNLTSKFANAIKRKLESEFSKIPKYIQILNTLYRDKIDDYIFTTNPQLRNLYMYDKDFKHKTDRDISRQALKLKESDLQKYNKYADFFRSIDKDNIIVINNVSIDNPTEIKNVKKEFALAELNILNNSRETKNNLEKNFSVKNAIGEIYNIISNSDYSNLTKDFQTKLNIYLNAVYNFEKIRALTIAFNKIFEKSEQNPEMVGKIINTIYLVKLFKNDPIPTELSGAKVIDIEDIFKKTNDNDENNEFDDISTPEQYKSELYDKLNKFSDLKSNKLSELIDDVRNNKYIKKTGTEIPRKQYKKHKKYRKGKYDDLFLQEAIKYFK